MRKAPFSPSFSPCFPRAREIYYVREILKDYCRCCLTCFPTSELHTPTAFTSAPNLLAIPMSVIICTFVGVFWCSVLQKPLLVHLCGMGFVHCLSNLLYWVIWWLHLVNNLTFVERIGDMLEPITGFSIEGGTRRLIAVYFGIYSRLLCV